MVIDQAGLGVGREVNNIEGESSIARLSDGSANSIVLNKINTKKKKNKKERRGIYLPEGNGVTDGGSIVELKGDVSRQEAIEVGFAGRIVVLEDVHIRIVGVENTNLQGLRFVKECI